MIKYKKVISGNRAELIEGIDSSWPLLLQDITLQEIIAEGTEEELREYGKEMYFIN